MTPVPASAAGGSGWEWIGAISGIISGISGSGMDEDTVKNIDIPRNKLLDFCRRNHIHRLALFGSVLREDFRPDSDVDVLVEFEPGHVPGFLRLASMERDLSPLLGGRKADVRTPQDLSRYFRDEVVASAEVQYAQK